MSSQEGKNHQPKPPSADEPTPGKLDGKNETYRSYAREKIAQIFYSAKNWIAKFFEPANIVAIALCVVTVFLVCETQSLVVDGRTAAANQLTLQFPPKLILRNMAIYTTGGDKREPPKMIPGEQISGVFHMANVGREGTTRRSSPCVADWFAKLPMIPPYEDPIKNPPGINCKVADGRAEIPAGDTGWITWEFSTTVPADYKEKSLYVTGYIWYTDSLSTWRTFRFARRYDPDKQIFMKVTDIPDYEGYDE